tara:strand:- start:988 stop:1185 length:198 start_codon:yes stop_codon:yes gene_type:complete
MNDGWDLVSIEHRLEELELRKNKLTLIWKNNPNKISKEILQIESLINLNKEIKAFLEQNNFNPFH